MRKMTTVSTSLFPYPHPGYKYGYYTETKIGRFSITEIKKSHHWFRASVKLSIVLGMIPHKTWRGAQALKRMKTFEGCPPPYDKKKKMVCPQALRYLCLKPSRKVHFHFYSCLMFSFIFAVLQAWPFGIRGRLEVRWYRVEVGRQAQNEGARVSREEEADGGCFHAMSLRKWVSSCSAGGSS